MGRISLMDSHPDLRQVVAEEYANGANNQQIANVLNVLYPELNVHKDTVIQYRRHPAVLAQIKRLLDERHARVIRKVDSALESRLEHADKMDTKTILEIRKTLAGEKRVIDDQRSDEKRSMTEELFDLADEDPEAAERIMAAQAADEQS